MTEDSHEPATPRLRVVVTDNKQLAVASSDPSIFMDDEVPEEIAAFHQKLDELEDAVNSNTQRWSERVRDLRVLLADVRVAILKDDRKHALELIGREIGW